MTARASLFLTHLFLWLDSQTLTMVSQAPPDQHHCSLSPPPLVSGLAMVTTPPDTLLFQLSQNILVGNPSPSILKSGIFVDSKLTPILSKISNISDQIAAFMKFFFHCLLGMMWFFGVMLDFLVMEQVDQMYMSKLGPYPMATTCLLKCPSESPSLGTPLSFKPLRYLTCSEHNPFTNPEKGIT